MFVFVVVAKYTLLLLLQGEPTQVRMLSMKSGT